MDNTQKSLFFSIRPQYANAILNGDKTVELRRVKPAISQGADVLIYASSPEMMLVGGATVDELIVATPEELWHQVGLRTAVSYTTLQSYFEGAKIACGIVLNEIWSLRDPLSLSELRQRLPGFHPPQSYRFFEKQDVDQMLAGSERVKIEASYSGRIAS